jgi:hypothetical protein
VADLDLAAIEARARAATPGPLHVRWLDDDRSMNVVAVATTADTGRHEQLAADVPAEEIVALTLFHGLAQREDRWDEDAALFAHAREDVLALAVEVRKLRWCARVMARLRVPEPDPALALVAPAALEAWLLAHGWRVLIRRHTTTGYDHPEHRGVVRVPLPVDYPDYGAWVAMALRDLCAATAGECAPALVLAELLPEHGPWEAEHG